MSRSLDPKHHGARQFLRVLGPAIVVVGVIFAAIGLGSFFSAFSSHQPPRYFWCAFIGLPLVGVGVAISKFAYIGAITRYMANELAPVGKDVVAPAAADMANIMAKGTRGAVRDLAAAVGEGLRHAGQASDADVQCRKCRTDNDTEANFCKNCGAPLATRCAGCGELNEPDASFCNHCGKALA